jgi:hypothetical protein
MRPIEKKRGKWLVLGGVGIITLSLAGLVLFFMIKADQADSGEQVVYSEGNQKDNGSGIALPGLEGGQNSVPLGSPSSDPNSVAVSGGQQTPATSQQKASGQPGQSVPVRSQTLPNGLKIEEYNPGTGERVTKVGDTVAAHYIGYLADGKVFDTSLKGEKKPFAFKLGAGQVIQGWDIGLQDMKVGAVRRLTIPASLAYGAAGAGGTIPPNATLVFDIQLIGIQ